LSDIETTINLSALDFDIDLEGLWTIKITSRAKDKLDNLIADKSAAKTDDVNSDTHVYLWSAPEDELDYEILEDLEERIRCNKHGYAHRMWLRNADKIDTSDEAVLEVGGIKFCISEYFFNNTEDHYSSLTIDYLDGGFGSEWSWFTLKHEL